MAAECIFMSKWMENNQIQIILYDLILTFVKEKNYKRNVKQ